MSWSPDLDGTILEIHPDQSQEISQTGEQNVDKEMVGLDLGKSSHMKRRKMRSIVWEYFTKYTDENGYHLAKCNLCEKLFDGSSKKGTTHLRNHYTSCQKKRNEGGCKPNEVGNFRNPIAINEKSVMDDDQPLNRLDKTRMIIQQGVTLPNSIEAAYILDVYDEEKEKLSQSLKKRSSGVCLTVDDYGFGGFTCFAVCFIDDDWKLKNKMIAFKRVEVQNAVKCLKNVLLEWGIDNNISYMVKRDYNDRYGNVRENCFSSQVSLLFNRKLLCFDSLKDISDSYLTLLYDAKCSLHDRVSKIFNYIMETPSRNETFRIAIDRAKSLSKEVTDVVIPMKLELKNMFEVSCNLDNDSIVSLLENALRLNRAFFELENMDPYFKSINLTQVQWDQARAFYECYEDFSDVFFCYPWFDCRTANMHFPVLCSLYTKSLLLVKKLKNGFYLDEDKCFKFTEDMDNHWCESNWVLAVAAVLDPRFKMDIVKRWYIRIYGDEWESQFTIFTDFFTGVYNKYVEGTNNFKPCNSGSEETNSSITYEMLDPWGKPSKSNHVQSLNFELDLYLKGINFPLIEDFDILKWWQWNVQYFPTLARMAGDFLSIQISTPSKYCEIPGFHKYFDSDKVKEAVLCIEDWLNNPSDVRKQTGTFGNARAIHQLFGENSKKLHSCTDGGLL